MNGKFVNIWIIISVFFLNYIYSFSLLSFLFDFYSLSLSHRLSFFLSLSSQPFMVWWRWMVVSVCGCSGPRFSVKGLCLSLSLSLILLVFVVFGGGGFPQNISFGSLSFCGFWFFRVRACDFVVLCVCGCALLWIFFTKRLKSERDGKEEKDKWINKLIVLVLIRRIRIKMWVSCKIVC